MEFATEAAFRAVSPPVKLEAWVAGPARRPSKADTMLRTHKNADARRFSLDHLQCLCTTVMGSVAVSYKEHYRLYYI